MRVCLSYLGNLHAVPYASISCLSLQYNLYGRSTVYKVPKNCSFFSYVYIIIQYFYAYLLLFPLKRPSPFFLMQDPKETLYEHRIP